MGHRRLRRISVAAIALAPLRSVGVAGATTIVGTAKGDILKGSVHADKTRITSTRMTPATRRSQRHSAVRSSGCRR